jgi:RNA polymerase sigma-70 factor (ECF subfamily)
MSAAPPLAFPAEDVAARALRILSEHAGSLERLAASYARSRADRADLLQDIALGLWLALPGFREACSERTFVLRIAHNRALTFLSKRGVRTEDIDERANDVVATTGKNPAIVLERGERDSRLLSAVRALPVAQRQVITLLLEGLSQREIAEIVGATENNVNVRVHRARTALRILLTDEGETNEERKAP